MAFFVLIIVLVVFCLCLVYKQMTKDDDEDKGTPTWWKVLFWLTMAPSVLWPFVLLGSAFAYDSPGNYTLTTFNVLAVDTYPIYMLGINLLALYVFKRTQSKLKSLSMYLIPIVVYLVGLAYLMTGPLPKSWLKKTDYRTFFATPAYDLAAAIDDDDSVEVADILKEKPELANYKDKYTGESMLFLAFDNGKYHAMKALVLGGVNMEEADVENSETVLHNLCWGSDKYNSEGKYMGEYIPDANIDMAKFMLDHGAEVDVLTDSCKWYGNAAITPLQTLCGYGPDSPKMARVLIEHGANRTLPLTGYVIDGDNAQKGVHSLLYCACYKKNYNIALLLLDMGVNKDSETLELLKDEYRENQRLLKEGLGDNDTKNQMQNIVKIMKHK